MKQCIKIATIVMVLISSLSLPTQAAQLQNMPSTESLSLAGALIGTGIILTPTIYRLSQLRKAQHIRDHKKRTLKAHIIQEKQDCAGIPVAAQAIVSFANRSPQRQAISRRPSSTSEFAHDLYDSILPFLHTKAIAIQNREEEIEKEYKTKTVRREPFFKWERPWNWIYMVPAYIVELHPIVWPTATMTLGLSYMRVTTSLATRLSVTTDITKKFTQGLIALPVIALPYYLNHKWEQSRTRAQLQVELQAKFQAETDDIFPEQIEPHLRAQQARAEAEAAITEIDGRMQAKHFTCSILGLGVASAAISGGLMLYSKYAAQQ